MTDVLIKRSTMDTETDMHRDKANYKPRTGTLRLAEPGQRPTTGSPSQPRRQPALLIL